MKVVPPRKHVTCIDRPSGPQSKLRNGSDARTMKPYGGGSSRSAAVQIRVRRATIVLGSSI